MMFGIGVLTTLLALSSMTAGYQFYQNRVPNGNQVPHPCKPNYIWQGVGHINALGGGDRNAFGRDFLANGATWNQALCQLDSDGDGLTNGQELGDPDCNWTEGSLPSRTVNLTHPGVCDPWNDSRCMLANTWVDCDTASFTCPPVQSDPDTRNLTLRFPPTPVPNTETNYMCMTFDLPGDDEYHLVATEPFIDNAQVMHHILVYGCEQDNPPSIDTPTLCGMESTSGCDDLIGLWAVGIPGMCFHNETGFRFGRGSFTRVKLEFHWNNPELRGDYTDSSGMTFYYTTNLRPYNAATMMIGQQILEIPPLQPAVQILASCHPDCTSKIFTQPLKVSVAYNHMHYLGKSQKVEVFRDGQLALTLTNDEVYSYDSPVGHVHDPPVELLPGDELRTTCVFNSQYRNVTTYYGESTSAEMCFAFLTVYPREALQERSCLGYRDISVCGGREDLEAQSGCNLAKFGNTSDPEVQFFLREVSTRCAAFSPCNYECRRMLEQSPFTPCFSESVLSFFKDTVLQSFEGTYFLAQVMSCLQEATPCPPCPTCPTTTTTTAAPNTNNEETGGSAALLPQVVAMVTLVVVSSVYGSV